jgi:hypothetical protein
MDKNAAFPANFPVSFRWLYNFTIEEKTWLTRCSWRTRNFHAMLPQFFAALQLVVLFAFRDIYIIEKCKFRKINACIAMDSKLQIPFDTINPKTWKSYMYRTFYDINNVYTATQLDNMIQHVFLTFDEYKYLIPKESVKLGDLLIGKFKNVIYNDEMKIIGDYPVDLMLHDVTYCGVAVFGADWTDHINGWFLKLQGYMTSAFLVYDKIEYNDKFYQNVFGDFKAMFDPIVLTSKMMCEWNELPLPWFHVWIAAHYDNVSLRSEFLMRAMDAAYDNAIDLDDGNLAGGFHQAFIRDAAGLGRTGATVVEYLYALKPYGYTEEQWKLALVYGWMIMQRYSSSLHMQTTVEFDVDMDDICTMLTYTQYLDKEDNIILEQYAALGTPANDRIMGFIGFGDMGANNYIFNSMFIPRALESNEYATLDDDVSIHVYNAGPVANNNNTYFARFIKQYGVITIEASAIQSVWVKESLYKILNPRLAPPSKKQEPAVKKLEEKIEAMTPEKKTELPGVKSTEAKPMSSEKPIPVTKALEGEPSSVKSTDEIIKKVDEKLSKPTEVVKEEE